MPVIIPGTSVLNLTPISNGPGSSTAGMDGISEGSKMDIVVPILIVRVSISVPNALEAVIVTSTLPVVVGDPDIKPVAVFNERPSGNGDALKDVGLLAAVIR